MKLRRSFALFIIFALALSLCAHADVVPVPNVDFFYDHAEECEIHNEVYYTNGAEGYVMAFSTPTAKAKVVIPNGKELRVSALWLGDKEGTVWGCIEYDPESFEHSFNGEDAWVDMSSMHLRYGSQEFMAEHENELQHGLYELEISKDMEVIAYRYPGSGIIVDRFPYYKGWSNSLSLDYIYTDSEGRDWGHVNYYYATRSVWVCISDPCTELPAGAEYREPQLIPAASAEELENVSLPGSGLSGSVIAGAVGVLVIAAAVIMYIILKKRREK